MSLSHVVVYCEDMKIEIDMGGVLAKINETNRQNVVLLGMLTRFRRGKLTAEGLIQELDQWEQEMAA